MPSSRVPSPAISAPDLIGPTSILNWPAERTPSRKTRRPRIYAHVRLEIDLAPETVREIGLPVLRQIETILREREVVEVGDVLRLTARLLHAFSAEGYSRVDHWEADPGGWLPLPEPTHEGHREPVGHLLKALESDAWKRIAMARTISVRLSGPTEMRADLTVRRVHRERRPAVSLDLWGTVRASAVRDLVGAIRDRLPILRSRVTDYA